ncbi:MAG: hemolysin III family protein [Treponema sp.]|jgi:hemolysin III|nr:hemolysin III family protein [Treponema sp.]
MNKVIRKLSIGEEIANSILHGLGVLAATAGLVLLTLQKGGFLSWQRASRLDIMAVLIFTITMILMFLMSTLYHAIQHEGAKRIFRKLDHCAIFIFIAGTYTPFCLIGLKGAWGWSIFAFEWTMAILGIIFHSVGLKSFKKFEVAAYILMGWAIIAGFIPLIRSIPVISIIFLFAGGAAYTLGVVWYRKKNLIMGHIIWHIFVIIGTVCHWFSIWYIN